MPDYVICARNTRTVDGRKVFGEEPGPTKFLEVPDAQDPDPSHAIARTEWVGKVMALAETGTNPQTKRPIGDILVFIHGFNNSQEAVMKRLRRLKVDIAGEGFDGVVIAYDWPSGEQTLGIWRTEMTRRKQRVASGTTASLYSAHVRRWAAKSMSTYSRIRQEPT